MNIILLQKQQIYIIREIKAIILSLIGGYLLKFSDNKFPPKFKYP